MLRTRRSWQLVAASRPSSSGWLARANTDALVSDGQGLFGLVWPIPGSRRPDSQITHRSCSQPSFQSSHFLSDRGQSERAVVESDLGGTLSRGRATCAREVMFCGNSRIPCRSSSHPCVRLEPTLPIRPTVTAAKSPLNWTGPTARRREHVKIIKARTTLLARAQDLACSHPSARSASANEPGASSPARTCTLARPACVAARAAQPGLARGVVTRCAAAGLARRGQPGTYHTSALLARPVSGPVAVPGLRARASAPPPSGGCEQLAQRWPGTATLTTCGPSRSEQKVSELREVVLMSCRRRGTRQRSPT